MKLRRRTRHTHTWQTLRCTYSWDGASDYTQASQRCTGCPKLRTRSIKGRFRPEEVDAR